MDLQPLTCWGCRFDAAGSVDVSLSLVNVVRYLFLSVHSKDRSAGWAVALIELVNSSTHVRKAYTFQHGPSRIIYIYIYILVCVCVCVCIYIYKQTHTFLTKRKTFTLAFDFYWNDFCGPFWIVTFLRKFFLNGFFLCRPYTTYNYRYQHRYFHAGIFVCILLLIARIPGTRCVECQNNTIQYNTICECGLRPSDIRRISDLFISYIRSNGACARLWGEGNGRH